MRNDEVDPDVVVKSQESGAAYLDELMDSSGRWLLEVVDGCRRLEPPHLL
jgi:hypothetical protein